MRFTNKVILITGASSGIGAHTAVHLARKGGSIVLVGRNKKRLNEVSDQIKRNGSTVPLVIVADITTEAGRIISTVIGYFGKLDVLINNAGIQSHNSVEDIDLDEYDRIMNTNVRSVIQLSKLAVPHLEKTKGNILNVSSACGLRVKPNLLAYCISKAAVNQFTKSAALDLASKAIRVNAICPVVVRTTIFETGFGMTSEQTKEFYSHHKALYPLGRVGETTDTSAAIEYLISDAATFMTGLLLPIDGGALTAGQ